MAVLSEMHFFATNSRQISEEASPAEIEKPRKREASERHRYRDSNPGFRTENPAS
jgi:hypothetical protein